MAAMSMEIRLGDVVRLRKPHPCGGYEWSVVRLGADIGLQCATCNRRVLLTRREFEKRVKAFVRRGDPASGAAQQPGAPPAA
jgi:hypothetical protein